MAGTPRGSYRTGVARRARIVAAARDLFVERGYRATSLREIARAAGLSHPGLLKHFATKAEILGAVVEDLESGEGRWWERDPDLEPPPQPPEVVARRNAAVPGFVELFTTLYGEAVSPEHPARPFLAARTRFGLAYGARLARPRASDDEVARREIVQVAAAWEGMQVLWLYLPDRIDIPARLAEHMRRAEHRGAGDRAVAGGPVVTGPMPARARATGSTPVDEPGAGARGPRDEPDIEGPHGPRDRALVAAARSFAERGYWETTMGAVGAAAGLTPAALVHLFATKRALLRAVTTEVLAGVGDAGVFHGPREAWTRFVPCPTDTRWRPAALVVLACEAAAAGHPAHDWFAARFARQLETLAGLFGDGGSESGGPGGGAGGAAQDPHEAVWLLGLQIGLTIRWLHEPDSLDPRAVFAQALDRYGAGS